MSKKAALAFILCFASLFSPLSARIISVNTVGEISYLFDDGSQVLRYHHSDDQWLSRITFPAPAGQLSAGHADADGLYVAFGKTLFRYSLDGTSSVPLGTIAHDVHRLQSDDRLLFAIAADEGDGAVTSFRKSTNAIASTISGRDSLVGATIVPSLNKIVGIDGTREGTTVDFDTSGTLSNYRNFFQSSAPYQVSAIWPYPNGDRLIDNLGHIRRTTNFEILAQLPVGADDVVFSGLDVAIALKGDTLHSISNSYLPTQKATLSKQAFAITLHGQELHAFMRDQDAAEGYSVERVSLTTLKLPKPRARIDGASVSYVPDYSFIDSNGILYLLSRKFSCIFKWDPGTQAYLDPILLDRIPRRLHHSETLNRIYLVYDEGRITRINLSGSPVEREFFQAAKLPQFTFPAGENLAVIVDHSDRAILDSTGAPIQQPQGSSLSISTNESPVWSPATERIYYTSSGVRTIELSAEGILGESKWHHLTNLRGALYPSPNGSILASSDGDLIDADSLEPLANAIGNAVEDAVWIGNDLKTIRQVSEVVQFQEWNGDTRILGNSLQVPGKPLAIHKLGNDRLVGVVEGTSGRPALYVLNASLELIAPPSLETPMNVSAGVLNATSVRIDWNDITGEEGYRLERRVQSESEWETITKTGTSIHSVQDRVPSGDQTYEYRVTAFIGDLESEPSAAITVTFEPPAAPSELVATPVSRTSILLTWEDGDLESEYEIQRSTGSSHSWSNLDSVINQSHSQVLSLNVNTEYHFRVRSVNGLGSSSWVEVVVRTDTPAPTAPRSLRVSAQSSFTVFVSWTRGNFADQQIIERQVTGASEWEEIGMSASSSFQDKTVQPGESYRYRVYAQNSHDHSGPSETVDITVPPISPPELQQSGTVTAAHARITWRSISGVSQFVIERRQLPDGEWTEIGVVEIPSFTDSEVTALTDYEYRARSRTEFGDSASSTVLAISVPDVPNTELRLASGTAVTGSHVRLDWNNVSGVASYLIERRSLPDGLWEEIAEVQSSDFVDIEVRPLATYEYRLRTRFTSGDSQPSEAISVTLPNLPAPELQITSATAFSVNLRWSTIPNASSYLVERRDSEEAPWEELAAPSSFFYEDQTVEPEKTYFYRVRSESELGDSPFSEPAVAILPPLPVPVAPTLSAQPTFDSSIQLAWTSSPGAQSYLLERREERSDWVEVVQISDGQLSYLDGPLIADVGYTYRISAANEGGSSPYSITALNALDAICLLENDFSSSAMAPWTEVRGAEVIRDGGDGFLPGSVLWFGGGGPRALTTIPLNVRDGAYLHFTIRAGNAGDDQDYWDSPGSGEELRLEYSLDGSTWGDISLPDSRPNGWRTWTITIPAAAATPATRFRWRQTANSGPGLDTWALADFCVMARRPGSTRTPQNLHAVSNRSRALTLGWDHVPGALGYVIQKSEPGSPWSDLASIAHPATSFVDPNVTATKAYAYRIASVNEAGRSPFSVPIYLRSPRMIDDFVAQIYATPPASLVSKDRFGITALERFAYNLPDASQPPSPIRVGSNRPSGLPSISLHQDRGTLHISFPRRRLPSGIRYVVEVSGDFQRWIPLTEPSHHNPINAMWETVTYEDTVATPEAPARFARVRVILTDF